MENLSHLRDDGDPRLELSEPQEDYLKQIFLLGGDRKRVSTQALARRLGIRPASVTEMVVRLDQLRLVDRTPYRGVRLTAAGRRVALEMLRHHRLLETYLVEALGYDWHQVHDEAERLEHVISELFEERIAEVLGHPAHDPHGDPIPSVDLSLPEGSSWERLSRLPVGSKGTVARVGAQDPDSLGLFARLGLAPGSTVEVVKGDRRGVRVRVNGEGFLLPAELADMLWMEGTSQ